MRKTIFNKYKTVLFVGWYVLAFVILIVWQSLMMDTERMYAALSAYMSFYLSLCSPILMILSGSFWRSRSISRKKEGYSAVYRKTLDTYIYFLQVEMSCAVVLFVVGWLCGYSLVFILAILTYVIGFLSLAVVPMLMEKMRTEQQLVVEWKRPRCLFFLSYSLLVLSLLFPVILSYCDNWGVAPLILLFVLGILGLLLGRMAIRGMLNMFVSYTETTL